MRKLKAFRVPCILVFLGMICMLAGNFMRSKKAADVSPFYVTDQIETTYNSRLDGATNATVTDWRAVSEYHQNQLTSFLKQVKGVGDVSVLVYCDRSSILSLANNCTQDTSTIQESDANGGERVTENSKNQSNYLVIQDQYGNQKVVPLSETLPAISSVCVVCSGGNQASVRERVIQAICTLYHLPPSNIVVIQGE